MIFGVYMKKENKKIFGINKKDLFLWLFYTHLISKIPYRYGGILRKNIMKRLLKNMGEGASISTNVKILCPQNISLGNETGIANNVILDGRGGLTIDDYAIIGFESVVITSTHNHQDENEYIKNQGMLFAPVEIGKDVWIGARSVIFPGIKIDDGAIVGACSLVNKNVPKNVIVGGIPAKFIKNRINENRHEQ